MCLCTDYHGICKILLKIKIAIEGLQNFLIIFITFSLSLHSCPKPVKADDHIFMDFHQKKLWAVTTGNSEIPQHLVA